MCVCVCVGGGGGGGGDVSPTFFPEEKTATTYRKETDGSRHIISGCQCYRPLYEGR